MHVCVCSMYVCFFFLFLFLFSPTLVANMRLKGPDTDRAKVSEEVLMNYQSFALLKIQKL